MAKRRLDVAIMELGLAESRQKAQALIMAGEVYVNGQKQLKAGASLGDDDTVEVRTKHLLRYVSRGGLKLEKAMSLWPIDLQNKICADIGASTGGFTDCMLQNGAKLVYAVDVGYNQLDWKLRIHPQVVCMERTNARYLTAEHIPESLDFFSVDVSFISLNLILPALRPLMGEEGQAVCLVKPQFEAGKGNVGKKGVVRDLQVHREVIGKIIDFADLAGFAALHLDYSPVRGPEGNIEYLLHLEKMAPAPEGTEEDILKKMQERGAGPSGNPCWKDLTGKVTREAAVSAR